MEASTAARKHRFGERNVGSADHVFTLSHHQRGDEMECKRMNQRPSPSSEGTLCQAAYLNLMQRRVTETSGQKPLCRFIILLWHCAIYIIGIIYDAIYMYWRRLSIIHRTINFPALHLNCRALHLKFPHCFRLTHQNAPVKNPQ